MFACVEVAAVEHPGLTGGNRVERFRRLDPPEIVFAADVTFYRARPVADLDLELLVRGGRRLLPPIRTTSSI